MTTFEARAGSRAPGPPLLELFDEEILHHSVLRGERADPVRVRHALQEALDGVAAGTTDAAGRQVVEMARQAVASLDTVLLRQDQRPRAEPKPRSSLGKLLDFGGFDEPAPVPARAWLEVSVDRLVDAVRDTLDAGERLRREAVPPPPEIVARPWAEDPDLVRLLHDLLAAARRPDDFLRARVGEQLADDLRLERGIEVLDYGEATAHHFKQVPATVDSPRTIAPALVHDGVLLRQGEVHVPASAPTTDSPGVDTPDLSTPTTGGSR